MTVEFLHPQYFFLLLLLIPMIGWYVWKLKNMSASLQLSSLKGFHSARKSRKMYLRHLPMVFRVFAVIFTITALARPQSSNKISTTTTEGIDIIISLDVSTSMLAMDLQPNRIEAAKEIGISFIKQRPNDRIGLVTFAAESFTQCPLTTDHAALVNIFREIETGVLEDGTAIGYGIAKAVQRIKGSDSKSKVIILLSDGENNRGHIDPLTAAEIARTFGIRVYTIGVAAIGTAPFPVTTPFGTSVENVEVRIDEEMMKEIATITGGKYFRATNNAKLQEIYREIDMLEKTRIEVREYTKKSEEFLLFALLAFAFLVSEIVLRNTLLRTIP